MAPYTVNGDAVGFEVPKDYKKASPVTVIKVSDKQAKGKATITRTCSHDARRFRAQSTTSWRSKTSCPPTGTVRAAAGDVVDHVKTGQDGRATTKELYLAAARWPTPSSRPSPPRAM